MSIVASIEASKGLSDDLISLIVAIAVPVLPTTMPAATFARVQASTIPAPAPSASDMAATTVSPALHKLKTYIALSGCFLDADVESVATAAQETL